MRKITTADILDGNDTALLETYGFSQREFLEVFKNETDVDWLFNKLKEYRLKNLKIEYGKGDLVAFRAMTDEIREFFLCDYAPFPKKEIHKIKYLPFLRLESTVYPISIIISFYLKNRLISVTASEVGEINIFIENSLFLSYNLHGKEIKDIIFSKDRQFIAAGDSVGLLSILNVENYTPVFRRSQNKKFRNRKFQYVIFKLENSIEVIHWTDNHLVVVDGRGTIHLFHFSSMKLRKIRKIDLAENFQSVHGEPSLTVFCISQCNRYLLLGGNWCGVILVEFSKILQSSAVLYIISDRVVDISARNTDSPHFIISTVSDVFVLAYEKNTGSVKKHAKTENSSVNFAKLNREIGMHNNFSIAAFYLQYRPDINIMQGEGYWYRREIKGYFNEESIIFLNGRFEVDFCIIPFIMRTISVHEHNAFILSNGLIAVEHYGCICTANPVNSFNSKIDKKLQKNKIALFSLMQIETGSLIAVHPNKNIIAMGKTCLVLVNLYGRQIYRKDSVDLAAVEFSPDGQYLLYSTITGELFIDALYGLAFPLEGEQLNSQHNFIEQFYNSIYYVHKNYANNTMHRGELECGYMNEDDKVILPLFGKHEVVDAYPVDSHGNKAKHYVHNDYAKLIEHKSEVEKKSIDLLRHFYLSTDEIIRIESAVYEIYKNFDVLYDVTEGEAQLECMLANMNSIPQENGEEASSVVSYAESESNQTTVEDLDDYSIYEDSSEEPKGKRRKYHRPLIIPDSDSSE